MLLALASSAPSAPRAMHDAPYRDAGAANAATLRATSSDSGDPPSRAAIEAALAALLASEAFRHSKRHRAFMRYVVDATLNDRRHLLKEVVIGLDVFDRDLDGYDPARDSIVRVEVRRIRLKLDRYYAGEGRSAAVEIRLPVGRYLPTFARRAATLSSPQPTRFVVLPMRILYADASGRAIAAGLVDQLVDQLRSRDAQCRVVVPASADAPRVPTADFVVEGSLAEFGTRLRCVFRVADGERGQRLWSRSFDRVADEDPFQFQDRIVDAVCDAIERVGPGASA